MLVVVCVCVVPLAVVDVRFIPQRDFFFFFPLRFSLVSPHFYVCSMFKSTKRRKNEFIEGSANCTDARRERENENVLGEEERRSRPTKIRRNFTAVHHFCFTLQISQLFFFNDQRTRRNGEVEIDSGRKKISRHE